MFLLLSAAMMITFGSCTPKEPDLKRTDYLKLVQSTVDMTSAKADKTLTRKGFVATDASIRSDGLEALVTDKTYKFQSKDSTVVLHVGLEIKNDTVKQYVLTAELDGTSHTKEAQKLYNDWSSYAYNTIFADISLWTATVFDENSNDDYGTYFIDGPWASMIKSLLDMYHMTGEMDEETYQALKKAFERKRGDFEAEMTSPTFLQKEGDIFETYVHATGTPDLSAMMTGNMSSLKGKVGAMTALASGEGETKRWRMTFVFMNEQDMSKIMENLPF